MNLAVLKQLNCESVTVDICLIKLDEAESKGEAELDEMWRFVGSKARVKGGCGTPLNAEAGWF